MTGMADSEEKTKKETGCAASDGYYRMGVMSVPGGFRISAVSPGKKCSLLLYRKGEESPYEKIDFSEDLRTGDVWQLDLNPANPEEIEYAFEDEHGIFADPYARSLTGRENWRDRSQLNRIRRSPLQTAEFDWQGDRPLHIPFDQSIIYLIHVRGFTESASSKVQARGTFQGITEKIPYLKELGINAVELLPCQEFEEIMRPDGMAFAEARQETDPAGNEKAPKVNYWGYTDAYRFAPKASYAGGKNPADAFKAMVLSLHKAGIEIIPQIYFTGDEQLSYVLDVLKTWVTEYHVDGIHLIGYAPAECLAGDPFLSETKLLFTSWDGVPKGKVKHLASCNENFEQEMRRFLKGDEGMVGRLLFHMTDNPENAAVVHYMASANGFTMMDMVSYDIKHNEENGENNTDGTDFNYSWNCGAEGPSRKKKITDLRMQQLRNAYMMLFLSQGTPLLLGGDEFGRTKFGNNNSYCQDNGISWLNWKLLESNRNIFAFAKHIIAIRKAHPVFRYPDGPKNMDLLSGGLPDVSYHGVNAWQPEFENWRRQFGILYCGDYAEKENGEKDSTFYLLFNMHWEPHEFALPSPGKNLIWSLSMNTADLQNNGFLKEGEEEILEDQKKYDMAPRSIVLLRAKEMPGSKKPDSKKPVRTKKKRERRKKN